MKNKNKYINAVGIYYPRELTIIKKKEKEPFRPLFEAFTNSIESKRH
jgi:hypothetical protein